jgi:hypothetical protein
VSGVSWGVLWYSCGPRLKKRTTTLRGAAVHVCVRYAWFCFWEPQPDIGARRGTVRSRRAPRSGIAASSVLGGLNRYVTHLFDHIASTHPSPARSRHTHRGPAFTRWRSLKADERNPGLPIPHRAGGLTQDTLSVTSGPSSFKVNTTFLLHATLQVQRSRQIVSSIHATT